MSEKNVVNLVRISLIKSHEKNVVNLEHGRQSGAWKMDILWTEHEHFCSKSALCSNFDQNQYFFLRIVLNQKCSFSLEIMVIMVGGIAVRYR